MSAITSYMNTAIWSETDSDGGFYNSKFGIEDISPETKEKMASDLENFLRRAGELGLLGPIFNTIEEIAADFWLTRNRHGAGFWDGDYPEPYASRLTALARSFGEVSLYFDEKDGFIHQFGG